MVNASDEPAIARQAIAAVVNRDVDAMVRLSTAWELYANTSVVMKEACGRYTYVRAISPLWLRLVASIFKEIRPRWIAENQD